MCNPYRKLPRRVREEKVSGEKWCKKVLADDLRSSPGWTAEYFDDQSQLRQYKGGKSRGE